MLTNEELKAAIAAARVYPLWNGYRWYVHDFKTGRDYG